MMGLAERNCARAISRVLLGTCALLFCVFASTPAHAADFSAWGYRQKITFEGYTKSQTLTNFPALVVLPDSVTDYLAHTNGYELRFAASNGTTELNYEVEQWAPTTNSFVWIQVDRIFGTNSYIWAYYGNVSVTSSVSAYTTNGATWTNGYKAVWHMGQTGLRTDSAGSYDGTVVANVTSTTNAKAGKADYFNGTGSGYGASGGINCGNVSVTGDQTIELWLNPNNIASPSRQNPINKAYGGCGTWTLETAGTINYYWGTSGTDGGTYQGYGSGNVVTSTKWHHMALVRNLSAPSKTLTWYLNGSQVVQGAASYSAATAGANPLYIGKGYVNTFPGYIDEVRVSTVARPADWMHATWLNMESNDVFVSLATVESQGPVVVNLQPTNVGSTNATLRGQVASAGGANPKVYFCWGTNDWGTTDTSNWANVEYMGTNWGDGQSFSTNLYSLTVDTFYYYQCFVTNSKGEDWADDVTTFITGEITVRTTDDLAIEGGGNTGEFTVYRGNATTNKALTVDYSVAGTAVNGTDYQELTGSVTIPVGSTNATITVTPTDDSIWNEDPITVTVTLSGGGIIGSPSNALLTILDNDSPIFAKRKMKISFSGYDKSETLTNFPALVVFNTDLTSFSYGGFESTNGWDLRFTDDTETNEINFEIEKWNTNGDSFVWVQVPILTNNAFIWALWGNEFNTDPIAESIGRGTWNDDYLGVWHMQSGTDAPDSTTNLYHGTEVGTVTQVVDALIGDGNDFDQDADYFTVPDNAAFTLGVNYTVEAWVNSDPIGNTWEGFFGTYNGNGFIMALQNDGINEWSAWVDGDWTYSGDEVTDDVWHHLVLTGDSGARRMYLDGQYVGSDTARSVDNGGELHLGAAGTSWAANRFDGTCDEFRMSTVRRSSNWIWACWFNQSTNEGFVAYAAVESVTTNILVTTLPETGLTTNGATLRGEVVRVGHAGLGENPYAYFCWGTNDFGVASTGAWPNVVYVGTNWSTEEIYSTNLTGLISGSNYAYRCYVTNSTGDDWSDTVETFRCITLPTVTNIGAVYEETTAVLRGLITDTGEEDPYSWIYYWPDGGSTSIVAKGTQSGYFETTWTGLVAGATYHYAVLVSNMAGTVWTTTNTFTTESSRVARDWYVSLSGDESSGLSWESAMTNIQWVLDQAISNDTIYLAGETFPLVSQLSWTASYTTIRGGYKAAGEPCPGTNNPTLWPTVLWRNGAATHRVMYANALTNCLIAGITFDNGYQTGNTDRGAGLYVANSVSMTVSDCTFANNESSAWGGGLAVNSSTDTLITGCEISDNHIDIAQRDQIRYGGGLHIENGDGVVTNCIIRNNETKNTKHGSSNTRAWGGGIGLNGGTWTFSRTVIQRNIARYYSSDYQPLYGGGVFQNAGTHVFRNCLIVTNQVISPTRGERGDGIHVSGGVLTLVNCTLAHNTGEGLRGNVAVTSTNCIFWGNGDDIIDPNGLLDFYYCAIEDGDSAGSQGCVTSNPSFVDSMYYHLASTNGCYVDGYFSGGTWSNASSFSLLIDACDITIAPTYEPYPDGTIINMGAYGNSDVASKSHPLRLANLAPNAVAPTNATLNGQILAVGSADVDVWFYWGKSDGGTDRGAWDSNTYWSVTSAPGQVSVTITGLETGSNYFYSCFASNAAGAMAWATPSTNLTAEVSPPEVKNAGVLNQTGPTATLKGEVTSTGGDTPLTYVCWGAADGGADTSAWNNVIAMGTQSGTFQTNITTIVGSNYFYTCFVTNSTGSMYAAPSEPFGHSDVRYVAVGATGRGTGYNWTDAYAALSDALGDCTSARTNILYVKQGTYYVTGQQNVSNNHVLIYGGYEGSGTPGNRDTDTWPTTLDNLGSSIRIMAVNNATNVRIDGFTITSGNLTGHGGGVYVNASTNVVIADCYIHNNFVGNVNNYTYGGGMYVLNSYGMVTNCLFERNRAESNPNNYDVHGGGMYLTGGGWTLNSCRFIYNKALASTTGGEGYGANLYVNSGDHVLKNCLIVQGESVGATIRGEGVYNNGGNLLIDNCTIAGNKGEGVRGNATTTIRNSIIWKNGNDIVSGTEVLVYSSISDGDNDGVDGCIQADPFFSYGWYLESGSLCVNGGTGTAVSAGMSSLTTSTNGIADSGNVDMGYHYESGIAASANLYVATTGNNTNSGQSAGQALRSLTYAISVAEPGAHIHVGAGTYTNDVETFPITIDVSGLHIIGAGMGQTVIKAPGNPTQARVITLTDASFIRLEGLSITGGYVVGNAYGQGAGIYLDNCTAVEIISCAVTNNEAYGTVNDYLQGGGIYSQLSSVKMADSVVSENKANSNIINWNGHGRGGGIYVASGTWNVERTVIADNEARGQANQGSTGGGLYLLGGPHSFTNCLIEGNDCSGRVGYTHQADGVYAPNDTTFDKCTIAYNGMLNANSAAEGIRGSANTVVRNSILWANGDDLVNVIPDNLLYSTIQDGDNFGANGCVDSDPEFINKTYYHLKSKYGHYTGGYFGGGSWVTNTALHSPLIDLADSAATFAAELVPNGARLNMGMYGNMSSASKSHPLDVSNLGVSAVTPTSATFNADLLYVGGVDVVAWFYYGLSDGTNNSAAWDTNVYVGVLSGVGTFNKGVMGLLTDSNYYYTCFASNAGGETAWGVPSTNFVIELSGPEVINTGVDNELTTNPTLKGEITSTGGDDPTVYICWGTVPGGSTPGSWQNSTNMGTQSGAFSADITIVAGSNYFYTCYGVNAYGSQWASPVLPFGASLIRYVDPSATGSGIGISWADAYTSVTTALAECTDARTNIIYLRGGNYVVPVQLNWTNSRVFIRGGYEGTGTPGNQDPSQWPSTITNVSNYIRILAISGVTNGLLENVTLAGADVADHGGGLYVVNSSNITVSGCTIEKNTASAAGTYTYGGGIYITNSVIVITNSMIARNEVKSTSNSTYDYGGGIYVKGGQMTLVDSVLFYNKATASGSSSGARGAGVYMADGVHTIKNCLLVQNDATATTPQGDGIHLAAGSVTIDNCTIAGNKGEGVRGTASMTVKDSILWKNRDDVATGAEDLQYSSISDGDSNGVNGCISAAPEFEYGFYLAAGSACEGSGSTNASDKGLSAYTTRADGTTDSGTVNLGYHHLSGKSAAYADLYVSPSGNDGNSGVSWAQAFETIDKGLVTARIGTYVHVAAGTYGIGKETFPILLDKAGVRLLGDSSSSTILDAAGSAGRVIDVVDASFFRIENVSIRGGYYTLPGDTASAYGPNGAGMSIDNATELAIVSCNIHSNAIDGLHNDYLKGGGIYSISQSSVRMDNSVVSENAVRVNISSWSGWAHGGGIYIDSSDWTIRNSVIRGNISHGMNNQGSYGGGIYLLNSTLTMSNSLVVTNDCTGNSVRVHRGDGFYITGAGTDLRVVNSTIADNGHNNPEAAGTGHGIMAVSSASSMVSNSIVWANEDDLDGVYDVYYSCIEDGDSNGVNGNVNANPEFVDSVYYHLRAKKGHYVDGYFAGGSWETDLSTNSPLIDAGGPESPWSLELTPNGDVINMGAYGNTTVASLSDVGPAPTVWNYGGASNVLQFSAILKGEVLSLGALPCYAWIFWGDNDGGTNLSLWDTNVLVRTFNSDTGTNTFWTNVTGLVSESNYFYRCFATNSSGYHWASSTEQFTPLSPSISITDVMITEGNAGTTNASFTVWLSGPGETNVTVYYTTADGSALAGGDYIATNNTLNFAIGETNKSVVVAIIGDVTDEGNSENFYVNLSNATNGILLDTQGICTIDDDDFATNQWMYAMKITFAEYDKAEVMTNFPALVVFSEALTGFEYDTFASATAGDLRFANSNGTKELYYEIEEWDTASDSHVWVNVPTISGTNTYIWALWQNTSSTTPPPYTTNGATWNAGYEAVWHLDQVGGSEDLTDSTANDYDATDRGNSVTEDGLIADSQRFDGDDDYLDVADMDAFDSVSQFTMSGWAYQMDIDWQAGLFTKYNVADGDYVHLRTWSDGYMYAYIRDSGTPYGRFDYSTAVADRTWFQWAMVFDGALSGNAARLKVYIDGKQQVLTFPSTAIAATTPDMGASVVTIGRYDSGTDKYWNGSLDEVRASNVARSSNWIWACWMNISSNSVFNDYGDVVLSADPVPVGTIYFFD